MKIEALLRDYQTKMQNRHDILLPENDSLYSKTVRAARYSLLAGGKRLRPILLLEFYKLCGGNDDCAYQLAAALEMIHTYSLIHDDLPCMDNDDMRRGRPSCHKQFDEAAALLAGDALLTEAFGAAAKTAGIPAERVVKAIGILSACAGTAGMIGGQTIDLENENRTVALETVTETYRLKTGALLKAAAVIGCILAGAEPELEQAAAEYGEKLGIAFQVIDDILDVQSDSAILGKPTGSDGKNCKNTFVSLLGIEESRRAAALFTSQAHAALKAFPGDISTVEAITDYLLDRKY